MADALHRAIRDALRDGQGYANRGILVTTVLEATRPLKADDSLLYRAVYTIFRALPDRLLRGTTLNVATHDTQDGVELMWEGREEMRELPAEVDGPTRRKLSAGRHADLVEIAYMALEDLCAVRAGHIEVLRERIGESSSFARPAHILRRVTAYIPAVEETPPESAPGSAGPPGGPATITPPPRGPAATSDLPSRLSLGLAFS